MPAVSTLTEKNMKESEELKRIRRETELKRLKSEEVLYASTLSVLSTGHDNASLVADYEARLQVNKERQIILQGLLDLFKLQSETDGLLKVVDELERRSAQQEIQAKTAAESPKPTTSSSSTVTSFHKPTNPSQINASHKSHSFFPLSTPSSLNPENDELEEENQQIGYGS